MKIIIYLLVILVLYSIYLFLPLYRATRKSAVLQAQTTAYEQLSSNSDMKILVLGDSTGVGTGAGNPKDSTAGRLGRDYPNADIENISQNGLRLDGAVQKLENIKNEKFDLILIQIGANDITHFTKSKDVQDRLSKLLNIAEEMSSKIIVLTSGNVGLAPSFKWPISSIITKRTLSVREIFKNEIKLRENVKYVDLYKDRENDIFLTDINKYYADDMFHPSEHGYGVWYAEISKVLYL